MKENIFSQAARSMQESLKSEEIKEDFLENCILATKELSQLKQMAKGYPELITSLKIFSASHTCETVLRNSIQKMEKAKNCDENPTTLEELRAILSSVIVLGDKIREVMDEGEVDVQISQIRESTLDIQEEAENLNLIEQIGTRLKRIDPKIRESLVKNTQPRA